MIEYILAIVLIGVLPARALYKSLSHGGSQASRPRIYTTSGAVILGLLVLLCLAWLHAGRAPALLGLGLPLATGGRVGMAVALGLLVALAIVEIVMKRKRRCSDAKAREKLANNHLLPRNRHELSLFLGFALLLGCGWELLYRGFLVWFLLPHVGTAGTICIAALAYGAAHGYKSRMQFLGSIVSAFAFTIAFVLSGSLWWLMLIHTAPAIAGGIGSYKLASREPADLVPESAEAAAP